VLVGYSVGRGAAGGGPVLLVTQDLERNLLTISGSAWGPGKPVVLLGQQNLIVERYSHDEIIAHLPAGIKPDLYLLTVASDRDLRTPAYQDTILYAKGG